MSDWIKNSGECLLNPNTRVDVLFRGGDEEHGKCADHWAWNYSVTGFYRHDIVAWRLSEKVASISVEELSEEPLQIVDKIDNVNTVDNVNNPSHYTSHKSGTECIEITRHMSFNLGNATKYIWRCDLKKDAIEDLRKAIFYLNDEIELRLKLKEPNEKL
jgi:hypothetical protein